MSEVLVEIKNYCDNFKAMQNLILTYFNDSNESNEQNNLTQIFQEVSRLNVCNSEILFDEFMHMLSQIASHHRHDNNFYEKMKKVINEYKNTIKNNYSNEEIFSIFVHNEPILIYLSQEEIFDIEDVKFLFFNNDYQKQYEYFFPDLPPEGNDQELGENHNKICKIIRSDQKEEFVSYIEQNNLSFESYIPRSIFETNEFLLKQKVISLLQYSAFYGSIEILKYVKDQRPDLINGSIWPFALYSGKKEIIEIIKELNTPPPKDDFKSCLLNLIESHQNELFELIQKNYSPESNPKDEEDNDKELIDIDEDKEQIFNPFVKAAIHSFNFSMISNLIEKVSTDDEFNEILNEASKVGFNKIVELIMKVPSIEINKCNRTTALEKACMKGNLFVTKLLISSPEIDINLQSLPELESSDEDFDGLTALSFAIRFGHNKIVELLLKQEKIDVNKKSRWRGSAPIHVAAKYNNIYAIELLLKCDGIDVNSQTNDEYKMKSCLTLSGGSETALHFACQNNYIDIVQVLLEANGINPKIKNWEGKTPADCTDDQDVKSLFSHH